MTTSVVFRNVGPQMRPTSLPFMAGAKRLVTFQRTRLAVRLAIAVDFSLLTRVSKSSLTHHSVRCWTSQRGKKPSWGISQPAMCDHIWENMLKTCWHVCNSISHSVSRILIDSSLSFANPIKPEHFPKVMGGCPTKAQDPQGRLRNSVSNDVFAGTRPADKPTSTRGEKTECVWSLNVSIFTWTGHILSPNHPIQNAM